MAAGITGNLTLFGLEILTFDLLQLIVLLCVAALAFIFIIELEFRQARRLARRFDDGDIVLAKNLRELRDSVRELGDIVNSGKKSPTRHKNNSQEDEDEGRDKASSDREEINMDRYIDRGGI
jgi:hypothetical protein